MAIIQKFGYDPPPAQAQVEPVFFSDWRTASVGSTQRTDLGKWNTASGSANMLDIVETTGLDFPSAKCLRVWVKNPEQGAIMQTNSIPIFEVGQSLHWRWYYRHMMVGGFAIEEQTHPIQCGNNASTSNWMFISNNDPEYSNNPYDSTMAANQHSPEIWPEDGQTSARFAWPLEEKGVTRRYELKMTRTGTTTYKMYARVYDTSDVLLHDDGDLLRFDLGGGQFPSMQSIFAASDWTIHDLSQIPILNCGNNGQSGVTSDQVHSYQGCFAVSLEDWCGPYGNVIGEELP